MSLFQRSLSPCAAALLFVGCSGSSDTIVGFTAGWGNSSLVVVDTEAGSDVTLRGTLLAIALELPGGAMTPNLLAEPTEITIAQARGSVIGMPMLEVPPGIFVAVNLLFQEGSISAEENGQPISVVPESLHQRIDSSNEPFEGRGRAVLMLAHKSALEIDNGIWRPRWTIRYNNGRFAHLHINIVEIDPQTREIYGSVPVLRDRVFRLDFGEGRGQRRSGGGHRGELVVGQRIRAAVELVDARTLHVLRLGTGEQPRGLRATVEGRITAITASPEQFEITDGNNEAHTIATDSSTVFVRLDHETRTLIMFTGLAVQDQVMVVVRRAENLNELPVADFVIVRN
jgi:hypothetical protein